MHRSAAGGRALRGVLALALLAALLGLRGQPAAASTAGSCAEGAPSCVAITIARLHAAFESEAASCDHDAVFSLAYLRVTQTFAWVRDQPGYFSDPNWLNREDYSFAGAYFSAVSAYQADPRSTPVAWRIAFDAARARRVSALGDALLGMNAHINRDLPFVLAQIGLTTPDGTSRKPDHNQANAFLAATITPLLDELAARFDPAVTAYGSLGKAGALALIEGWRELAWNNAQLLVAAPTPALRAVVAQQIETAAAAEATTIVATTAYLPIVASSGPRDAFCAVHHADPPPTPYAFGPAQA